MSDLEIRRIDPPIPDKFSLESILRCNLIPQAPEKNLGSFLNRFYGNNSETFRFVQRDSAHRRLLAAIWVPRQL